ncbi:hypothetical protein [Saliniramus fredricksonii]|uniref:hypothetical protein n=1 Tax=Saliniramus fredricksonii TaxID=1653334 RepID=UPI0013F4CC3C|nr:hypothetical protein [Saliniramus fredricksonii]
MFDLHGFPARLLRLPALVLLQNCAKARAMQAPAWRFLSKARLCPRARVIIGGLRKG